MKVYMNIPIEKSLKRRAKKEAKKRDLSLKKFVNNLIKKELEE